MRVAMVILEYAPLVGGAQRQLASLAPLLAQRGVEVHVLTRRARGLANREEIAGVPVHRLPAPGPKATASLELHGRRAGATRGPASRCRARLQPVLARDDRRARQAEARRRDAW